MSKLTETYQPAPELAVGTRLNDRVPHADQQRQRAEADEVLTRLHRQPGVILADEVGMGKTFVALAAACSVALHSRRGPVIVMVPPNLVDKWEQDLKAFCDLYLDGRKPLFRSSPEQEGLHRPDVIRYGVARHSVELMKLLGDPARIRCHLIFLAQGAMGKRQSDKWVRLAMIREALRRHGRGRGRRLIQVKDQIHRFIAELICAKGEQRASEVGEDIWRRLLKSDPAAWKDLFNSTLYGDKHWLDDAPVPEAVLKALSRIELRPLAGALEQMPVRARGGRERISERVEAVKPVLKEIEDELWAQVLARMRWRSPLLVLDEAHHLKNPATSLARRFQSVESDTDLSTGDGALARVFDRMLFLTATPFQLGHAELVRVLQRFGDIRWDKSLGERADFEQQLHQLNHTLTESQRASIALQRCWSRLGPDDRPTDDEGVDTWWQRLGNADPDQLTTRQRAVIEAFDHARRWRRQAQDCLRPWVIRHNKGERWSGTGIVRRQPIEGAGICGGVSNGGLAIPPEQMLPFFLAARSAVRRDQELLGEALCSSYEAFRYTRENRSVDKDDQEDASESSTLTHSDWYLDEFDRALNRCSGNVHPKLAATVRKAVDLWANGEKVVVFAFYRQTCRALRIHISHEIERRLTAHARRRLAQAGRPGDEAEIDHIIDSIQNRFFDRRDSPGRRALDAALGAIIKRRQNNLERSDIGKKQQEELIDVMRRFLRVQTTLIHCFPIQEHDTLEPHAAVRIMLETCDSSGISWRVKFEQFLDFLVDRCSPGERSAFLEAAGRMQTGRIRVEADDLSADDDASADTVRALANVQVATGTTRRDMRSRLMRAFNTPFFPDILICSQVMGEGVDLHRYCRHVIHHDLAWNPSAIEQRTGRIDRLGCKAEGRHPINVYLPYLAGTADERQYRVMTDRESWFRIVMGQDEVARLIPTDDDTPALTPPRSLTEALSFNLALYDNRASF